MNLNHYLLLATTILVFAKTSLAQDTITMHNGDKLAVKVLKVGPNEIEYKKWSNLEGPTYLSTVASTKEIKYHNGERDVFGTTTSRTEHVIAKQSQLVGIVSLHREQLTLNGRILDNKSLGNILAPDDFITYRSAQSQYNRGSGLIAIGWTNYLLAFFSTEMKYQSHANYSNTLLFSITQIVFSTIGSICLPIGYIIKGIGRGRLNWLVEQYNNRTLSGNIIARPALLKTSTSSIVSGYAVGLNLSITL